ncbi:MAG: hypothetical protein RRZ92_02240 [Bacilli bacterium]
MKQKVKEDYVLEYESLSKLNAFDIALSDVSRVELETSLNNIKVAKQSKKRK